MKWNMFQNGDFSNFSVFCKFVFLFFSVFKYKSIFLLTFLNLINDNKNTININVPFLNALSSNKSNTEVPKIDPFYLGNKLNEGYLNNV